MCTRSGVASAPWRKRQPLAVAIVRAAVIVMGLLDFATSALAGFASFQHVALAAVSLASVWVTLFRPVAGVVLAAWPIATIIFIPTEAAGALPLVVTAVAVTMASPPRVVVGILTAYAAVIAVSALAGSSLARVASYTVVLLVSAGTGLIVRKLRARARAASQNIASLEVRVRETRADERAALAGELSTLLVEGLAANGRLLQDASRSEDPATIAAALATTDRATRTALTRLRGVVATLRGTHHDPTRLAGVIEEIEDRLVAHGHPVEMDVPASMSGLTAETAALVERALRAVDDAAAGAPAGTTCAIALHLGPDAVRLRFTCPRSPGVPAAAFRMLTEDVAARGGSLTTGSGEGEWHLLLEVPADPPGIPASPPEIQGAIRGAGAPGSWRRGGRLVLPQWALPLAAALLIGGLALSLRASEPSPVFAVPANMLVVALAGLAVWHQPWWLAFVMLAWAGYILVWFDGRVPADAFLAMQAFPPFGGILGVAAHHFVRTRRAQGEELDRLAAAAATAREQERRQLAGELHDIVAHQLSLMSMQVMAHGTAPDLAELREAAEHVDAINSSARTDLTMLLHLLRAQPDEDARLAAQSRSDEQTPPQDSGRVTPRSVAAAVTATLEGAGHRVDLRMDSDDDSCDPTTQRTLTRVLREAATNIIRYAPPSSGCVITLSMGTDAAVVRVTSPLAASTPAVPHATGWGLLGLTERAQLTGGRFRAGPEGDTWVVEAALPRWAEVAVVGPARVPPLTQ